MAFVKGGIRQKAKKIRDRFRQCPFVRDFFLGLCPDYELRCIPKEKPVFLMYNKDKGLARGNDGELSYQWFREVDDDLTYEGKFEVTEDKIEMKGDCYQASLTPREMDFQNIHVSFQNENVISHITMKFKVHMQEWSYTNIICDISFEGGVPSVKFAVQEYKKDSISGNYYRKGEKIIKALLDENLTMQNYATGDAIALSADTFMDKDMWYAEDFAALKAQVAKEYETSDAKVMEGALDYVLYLLKAKHQNPTSKTYLYARSRLVDYAIDTMTHLGEYIDEMIDSVSFESDLASHRLKHMMHHYYRYFDDQAA